MTDEAVTAVVKTTQTGLETAQGLGRFFDKLFGAGLADWIGLKWSDRVAARRIEAKINDAERFAILIKNTRDRLAEQGIAPIRIPEDKVLLPLIEEATMEQEPDLQKLWANLLASAATDPEPIRREFVSILADLSAVSALALRDYYVAWQTMEKEPFRADGLAYGPGMDGDNYGYDVARSLVRLGLIEPSWIEFETYEPGGHNRYGDYAESRTPIRVPGDLTSVAMTSYGEAFCRAVGMVGDDDGKMHKTEHLRTWAKSDAWRG